MMIPLSPERSFGGCMVSGRSLLSQIASAIPVLLLVLLLHLVLLPRSSVVMGLPDAGGVSEALSRARIHGSPRGAAADDEACGLWIPQSHLGDTNDDPLLFQPSLDVDNDGTNRPPFGGLSIPKSLRLHSPAAAEQQYQEENEGTAVSGTLRRRNWSSLSGVTKTGTTIVGVRTSSGVVLAADTRATEGSLVADMTCEKLQRTYKGRRIGWVALERKKHIEQ
jgi:Proteasome subunit